MLSDFVIAELKAVFEPVEERGLEDMAHAVEGVAGEPDELGAMEAEAAHVIELIAESG